MLLMITHLILSLKRAVSPQDSIWSGQLDTVRFARHIISGAKGRGGDIALGCLSSEKQRFTGYAGAMTRVKNGTQAHPQVFLWF